MSYGNNVNNNKNRMWWERRESTESEREFRVFILFHSRIESVGFHGSVIWMLIINKYKWKYMNKRRQASNYDAADDERVWINDTIFNWL